MKQGISCPKCGASNTIGYQFCGVCGEGLQTTCPVCDGIVESTFRFCPSCGAGIGWGMRLLRDMQSQLAQTEEVLRKMITQYSSDIQSQIAQTKDGLESMETQYSSEIKSQSALLNQAVSGIFKLVGEKHRGSMSKALNKGGTGLVGLGLGVIVLSYTPANLPNLAAIGVIVIASGFLLQIISSFVKS
ncbi:MAG: zinc ribbon domain-containing protein [Chloroflexi bacterium]|nr:zinc ribbon domain-containing protein [Chloroflexota bacterium]